MNFIRSFFAATLGSLFALCLFLIFVLLFISGIAALGSSASTPVYISEGSVLRLDLDRPLVDRAPAFDNLNAALGLEPEAVGLDVLLTSIEKARTDDRILGISINAGFPQAGWAQLHELRESLIRFKNQGKWINAHSDFWSQKGYYLASVADRIYVHPMGTIDLKGLAAEVLYFKDFQDRFGAKMEVVRLGKYKSAVEPYLDNTMSEENRSQIKALLDSFWENIQNDIRASRALDEKTLERIVNNLEATQPSDALTLGIVDKLSDASDYEEELKAYLGTSKINWVDAADYGRATDTEQTTDRIAVLYASGPILYGEGSEAYIGQDALIEAIDDIVEHPLIKGVVLRIDSPGGAALTAEIIWKHLQKIKNKKPFVVSLGNVAASGGYYMAMTEAPIMASPLSVTGSIGVFATLPNFKKLSEDLGINAEHVTTHQNALGYSLFETLSPGQESQIQKGIGHTYQTFKTRVADARKMSEEEVERLAQGRVWSGKEALEKGLVDQFGGWQAALEYVAKEAQLESYSVVSYPKWEPSLERLMSGLFPAGQTHAWMEFLVPKLNQYIGLSAKKHPQHLLQMELPYTIKID